MLAFAAPTLPFRSQTPPSPILIVILVSGVVSLVPLLLFKQAGRVAVIPVTCCHVISQSLASVQSSHRGIYSVCLLFFLVNLIVQFTDLYIFAFLFGATRLANLFVCLHQRVTAYLIRALAITTFIFLSIDPSARSSS